MAPHTCCENEVKTGYWSPEEDQKLINYISVHGHGSWKELPKLAGLQRCGKSCRLRWLNYLSPHLKRGEITEEEASLIIDLQNRLGNKWAQIASYLPGRTDNEIKNFWNSKKKKLLENRNHATFSNNSIPILPNQNGMHEYSINNLLNPFENMYFQNSETTLHGFDFSPSLAPVEPSVPLNDPPSLAPMEPFVPLPMDPFPTYFDNLTFPNNNYDSLYPDYQISSSGSYSASGSGFGLEYYPDQSGINPVLPFEPNVISSTPATIHPDPNNNIFGFGIGTEMEMGMQMPLPIIAQEPLHTNMESSNEMEYLNSMFNLPSPSLPSSSVPPQQQGQLTSSEVDLFPDNFDYLNLPPGCNHQY